MSTSLSILVIVLLLIANAFFVAAEFALVKIRMGKAENFARDRGLSGRLLLKIKQNLESYLAACQLGITMASLGLGWVGEPAVAHLLEPLFHKLGMAPELLHTVSFLLGFLLFSSLHIVIGEQVPKTFAIRKPDTVSLWITVPLEIFYFLSYPLTKALDWASASILRQMGIKEASHDEVFSTEELSELIGTSSAHGHIDMSKADMIKNMFDFDTRIIRDIMVPRNAVDMLDLTVPWEQNLKHITEHAHSRYPLYEDSKENLLGYLLIKDLTAKALAGEQVDNDTLRVLARPAVIIPEVIGLQKAFDEMREKNNHMAFVIDEHGAFAGIITMEDLLEEIVGDIADEFDDEVIQVRDEHKTPDIYSGFEIDGVMPIHDFEKLTRVKFTQAPDISTISGLIMMALNGIPDAGDAVEYDGWLFKVLEVQNHRPARVFAQRLANAAEAQ